MRATNGGVADLSIPLGGKTVFSMGQNACQACAQTRRLERVGTRTYSSDSINSNNSGYGIIQLVDEKVLKGEGAR
eukprot:scaffold857_cov152-Ochromonas_danica.AAC.6